MFGLGLGPPELAVRRNGGAVALPGWIDSVDARGWSGQAGAALTLPTMTSDGTSEFGADGGSPKTVTVMRQGFDASGAAVTFPESVTITKRVRQAFPNQASATAATVALSDYVFAGEVVTGCANGSTEVSPRPVAVWSRPDRHVVTASDTAAVVAFHRCGATLGNLGIAGVLFTWSDGTNSVSATVTTPVAGGLPGDINPVIEFVAANVDLSSLSDGPVTRNARIYPKVGVAASVLDSATGTPGARAFAPQTILKSSTAPRYASVAASGNDATGVSSVTAATAAAAPFASVKGALDKLKADVAGATGIGVVRIGAGSFNLATLAAGAYTSAGEIVIERDPAVARGAAVVSWGANASGQHNLTGVSWLKFRDVSVLRTGATTLRAVSGGAITFENVNFDNGSQGAGAFAGITGSSKINVQMSGVTVTNAGANALAGPVGSHDFMLTRGVAVGSILPATPYAVESWAVLGSQLAGCRPVDNTKGESGTVIAFNTLPGVGGTAYGPDIAKTANVTGYAYVQNVHEWASAASAPAMGISRDNNVVNAGVGDTSHIIVWHNSFAGYFNQGRHNLFYDEKSGTYRTHRLMSLVGNIAVALNTKHDWYLGAVGNGTPDPGDAPLHTGGWAYLYGVGCIGEFARYGDAGAGLLGTSFSQAWPGLKSRIGATQSGAGQDPLFVTYAGTTTSGAAGAGGGNYAIGMSSPAKAMVPNGPFTGLADMAGMIRSGAQSAGAYQ